MPRNHKLKLDFKARPRKLAPWLEAERYFKRYRDTQKVTLERSPSLIVMDDAGPVDWAKLAEQDDGNVRT